MSLLFALTIAPLLLLQIVTLIYKSVVFPYPSSLLGAEATTLCFLALIDLGRMALGHKGNLTQARLPLMLFLVLSAPVILGHVFFINYQTYANEGQMMIRRCSPAAARSHRHSSARC